MVVAYMRLTHGHKQLLMEVLRAWQCVVPEVSLLAGVPE
jgi:hypothetical protein